jgi:hypothetical protein
MLRDGANSATSVQKFAAHKLGVEVICTSTIFGTPSDKEWSTFDYAYNFVDHLHEIHNFVRQHLQVVSNRLRTRYDKLDNCSGYEDGESLCRYRSTHTIGISPKLQYSCEGPYKVMTQIKDAMYRSQRNPRSKMAVVHRDRLAPYQRVARDERPYGGSSGSSWGFTNVRIGQRKNVTSRHDDLPLGYSGRITLRREQCDVFRLNAGTVTR